MFLTSTVPVRADGVIRDPRACNYSASALVPSGALTPKEAIAIDKIWTGSHDKNGTLSWYGIPRGASFDALANRQLMSIAYGQAKYWVELDPSWDYHSLTYARGLFLAHADALLYAIGSCGCP